MKKLLVSLFAVTAALIGVTLIRYIPGTSDVLWNMSNGGSWLLPLVFFSSILDSVHPCSFSILLITMAFLFSLNLSRRKILSIGGVYILGIFVAYFAIGIGLLKIIHFFSVPHFMGKAGALMLVIFGLINLFNYFFPSFPLRLKVPDLAHRPMAKLMCMASLPAAFGLGLLVGLCQFPCMGGPYLMVIGLLHDSATYTAGFGYLLLYNFILVVPLVVVLSIASNQALIEKINEWRKTRTGDVRLFAGMAMVIIGFLVFFVI